MVASYQLAITLGILCAYFSNVLVHADATAWSSMVGPCCERIFAEPWRARAMCHRGDTGVALFAADVPRARESSLVGAA